MPSRRYEFRDCGGSRSLVVDGDAAYAQSAMSLSDPHELVLPYTRTMMKFIVFQPQPRDLLVLGLGGGSMAKYVLRKMPQARLVCVEREPEVVELARSAFFLPEDDERLRVVVDDAARYVAEDPAPADVVLLDAYDGVVMPPSLCVAAFHAAVHRLLRAGGVLAVNLFGFSPAQLAVQLDLLAERFAGGTLAVHAGGGNVVAFALRDPPRGWRARAMQRALEHEPHFQLGLPRFARLLTA